MQGVGHERFLLGSRFRISCVRDGLIQDSVLTVQVVSRLMVYKIKQFEMGNGDGETGLALRGVQGSSNLSAKIDYTKFWARLSVPTATPAIDLHKNDTPIPVQKPVRTSTLESVRSFMRFERRIQPRTFVAYRETNDNESTHSCIALLDSGFKVKGSQGETFSPRLPINCRPAAAAAQNQHHHHHHHRHHPHHHRHHHYHHHHHNHHHHNHHNHHHHNQHKCRQRQP